MAATSCGEHFNPDADRESQVYQLFSTEAGIVRRTTTAFLPSEFFFDRIKPDMYDH